MYTHSSMQVKWKSELSNVFPWMIGVRHGGCLSPIIFTLFLDELIQKLKHSGIGWHIGRTYCGVLGYADDMAIVSPTLFDLRKLLKFSRNMHQRWTYYFILKCLYYYSYYTICYYMWNLMFTYVMLLLILWVLKCI